MFIFAKIIEKYKSYEKMKFINVLLFVTLCCCCTVSYAQDKSVFSLNSDSEIVVKGVGQDGTKVLTVTAKGKKWNRLSR